MTPQQQRTLDLVRLYSENGLALSYREIAQQMSLSSTSAVARLVDRLVASGHLTRSPGRARSLALAGCPDLSIATTSALRAELARRGEAERAPRAPERRATRGQPTCAADTCGTAVQRGHLFCYRHWSALPRELQSRIFAAHRAGDTKRYQQLVGEARDIADACRGVL